MVLGLLTIGRAQDVVSSVVQGSKAILFSFSGLSFLGTGTFYGGFGGRYFLSDAFSIRAGVQFTSANQTIAANPPAGQQETDGSTSASVFGFSGAAEWHMGKGRIVPYIGGGIGYSSASTDSKTVETGNPPPAQTERKNRTTGESVNGVTYTSGSTLQFFGLLGVQFFLYKEMSLSAEYRLGYGSMSRPDQEVTTGPTTTTTKVGGGTNFGIANSGAKTLSVCVSWPLRVYPTSALEKSGAFFFYNPLAYLYS